jgi:type VI secretion system protein ImpH
VATAGYGWQKGRSVEDWLIKEPYRFEFYQAVRLIEAIYRRVAGELASDDATFLRFRSRIGFDFPASEIQAIDTQDAPVRMTVNFLGLAGALGPLPAPYSEMIMAATARKDFAAPAFLGQLSRYLFSIIGLGPKPLRNRLGVPDRTLLHYAGLLGRQVRSAVGLEQLLTDYFGVQIRVKQFTGLWRPLDPEQWTALGIKGRNQILGDGAALGRRAWDQAGRVRLIVGPLSRKEYLSFLPGRSAHRELSSLCSFYLGTKFKVEITLLLRSTEVPLSWLGNSQLGHTSWLLEKHYSGHDVSASTQLNP